MARRRTLPDNLYDNKSKGKTYYRYKRPDGKFKSLGSNKNKAIAAAKQLNQILYPESVAPLVNQVIIKGTTTKEHSLWYMQVYVRERKKYASATVDMHQYAVDKLTARYGDVTLDGIDVKVLSDMMNEMTWSVAKQFRQVMTQFFRTAIALGERTNSVNPAEQTLVPVPDVQRQRLSVEVYQWVHAEAPTWLKNTMDLALVTLQRRVDLVNLKKDAIRNGVLYVIQQKTKKFATGYLAIQITPVLHEILERCDQCPMKGPHIIRRKPTRMIKQRNNADHVSQVTPEYVTRTFTAIINRCPLVQHLTPKQRPTFHEIRALGIHLYKKAGYNSQQLAGHASKQMNDKYDEGHEDVNWIKAEAKLPLPPQSEDFS